MEKENRKRKIVREKEKECRSERDRSLERKRQIVREKDC